MGAGGGVLNAVDQLLSPGSRAAGDVGGDQPGVLAGQVRGNAGPLAGGDGDDSTVFSDYRRCPIERVSWNEADAFIGRLNGRSGGSRHRGPTEAEWEYAARAGSAGDRYGNLDKIAWCGYNSGRRTQPVGQKAPNAWGLHDMLGNVWEWVRDQSGSHPGSRETDPLGSGSGSSWVYPGGSWRNLTGGAGRRVTATTIPATAVAFWASAY